MATFNNQATLSFGGRVTSSNITVGEVVTRLTLTKTAVSTDYGPGDNIVYAVTLVNNDAADKTDITLTDNLGVFTPATGPEVVPLTYVDGSVLYYQNGVLQTAPTVNAGTTLEISGITIPAGGNVIILYETRANEFAPRGAAATINNTVTADGDDICDALTGSASVPTRDEANLSIAKAISPDSVSCGDQVTYTFIIQNTGNTAVISTDDLILSDTFNPVLANITATLNGTTLTAGTDYTYDELTGEFATLTGGVAVPAASFVRDPVTGEIATTPGVTVLTVTGTI